MKTDDPRIVQLLELFDAYLPLAVQHLTLVNWHREAEADLAYPVMKVHFLFPNISDFDRADLVAMLAFNYSINLALNVPGMPADQIDASEQRFMIMKQSILDSPFYPSLTPVQKAILEAEFFSVSFPKT